MKKQKICIIGTGLTGLITAATLSRLNLKVDLIGKNINENVINNRTVAISQSNYDFLKKLNIFKFPEKEFWPCEKMKLYTETNTEKFDEIFELNANKPQKKILYMINNSKILEKLIKNIKKEGLVKLINAKNISGINSSGLLKSIKYHNSKNSKYGLVILCTGNDSNLSRKVFKNENFKHSYQEVAITTILKHKSLKNYVARQIFFDDTIFAFLPISDTETSIVWSLQKKEIKKYISNTEIFKKKILNYSKKFFNKIKFKSNIEFHDLNLFIRKKYYQDRVLLFGDALHVVHPLAGQGFNMTLRDLKNLEKILKKKIDLGLDIGNTDTLLEFSDEVKPNNLLFAMGIDFVKRSFSFKKKPIKIFRNKILKDLNQSNFVKNFFLDLADDGLNF